MATDYTQSVNCMGAWLFTEGSGTTVADASGEGNTANFKASGEPVWDVDVPSGYSNNSVNFDGSNDYVLLSGGEGTSLDAALLDEWSFCLWGLVDNATAEHKFGGYWTNDGGEDGGAEYLLSIGTDMKPFAAFKNTNGDYYVPTSTTALSQDTWYHFCITFKRNTVGGAKIYVDGVEVASANTGDFAIYNANDANVVIGGGVDTGVTIIQPFDGQMTEVAMFNTELTQTQIQEIMDFGLDGSLDVATTKFRKTFSSIGTGTGKRQMVGT